jgi:hypothetical protein
MPLILTAAPAAEPVSLAEAKAFLRVAHADEDVLISDLVQSAREPVEAVPGLALITQSWRVPLDAWPERLAGGIEIDFTAGFGPAPSDVPAPLREAILQLTATSYGGVERAETAQRGADGLPDKVISLISPWRRLSL